MAEHLAPYKSLIEGFDNPVINNMFQSVLNVPVAPGSSTTTPFLKQMLIDQKKLADSLMVTANNISPVAQKIVQIEGASDAAFESDVPSRLPNVGATLQGFTLIFFIVSFFALMLISMYIVNKITNSLPKTGITFGVFFLIGVILFSLIVRLG
jgi:hypothetical protein